MYKLNYNADGWPDLVMYFFTARVMSPDGEEYVTGWVADDVKLVTFCLNVTQRHIRWQADLHHLPRERAPLKLPTVTLYIVLVISGLPTSTEVYLQTAITSHRSQRDKCSLCYQNLIILDQFFTIYGTTRTVSLDN